MIRFPILVGDSYFGSEEHRALVQSATLRLFVKAPDAAAASKQV